MMTGLTAEIRRGYTGHDHLITRADEEAATAAVAGIGFRRATDAQAAAERAFLGSCDARVRGARVVVTVRSARGATVSA